MVTSLFLPRCPTGHPPEDECSFCLSRAATGVPLSTAKPCVLHVDHRPKTHINHRHHIWPLGEGGPNIPENLVVTCATGHENIHAILRLWKKQGTSDQHPLGYARSELRVARLGWARIEARGMVWTPGLDPESVIAGTAWRREE